MKQIKSFLLGFVTCAVLLSSFSVVFAKTAQIEAFFDDIKIKINGKLIDTGEDKPFIYNARTYLPARYIAEGLGATVKWNETNSTVEIDSAIPTLPQVTPTPTQNRTKTTPDGLEAELYEGDYYVKTGDIDNLYSSQNFKLLRKNFDKNPVLRYSLYLNRVIVLDDIIGRAISGYTGIEYNYYINTVYPILRGK